ncbi:MAG: ArsR family transcriptional regulator [Candidatus Bathyarchaeota archaeon]|nr:ArsR family transcriptional regulator [Candidatus Bathyarchaeota archaeon]MDD4326346.1 ArsR family transcriptional regulator [Candidatus Bathyarchaeota archaeon]MDT8783127.1 ArsR family transcriptional regulator [Candidatus Bathyarchaeota archaeon]NLD65861.1 ArsR family transcriptional regulator [Thermoproteota archaeon]
MTEKSPVDLLLTIVENPVRRKIIKRLSQEPSYALEIAKELGVGQQLVTAHLAMMERVGLISSNMETSPFGPKRRLYFLNQSACLSISFGPHLYDEQFLTFDKLPNKLSKDALSFLNRLSQIESAKDSRLKIISDLVADIDEKILRFEDEKTVLLYLRNLAMKHASEELNTQETTHDEKRILHFIIDEKNTDVEVISQALNLKESIIREIINRLREDFFYVF